jgi:hypothetical protein
MKTKSTILILFAILLAACAPVATPDTYFPYPTDTLAPLPLESSTPEPTLTETTIPTAAIPDYMQEYHDRGFDTMSGNGVIYLVVDETRIHYAPNDDGIVFQERIIMDWFEVSYIENGVLKHAFVIDFMGRGGNVLHKNLSRFMDRDSASEGSFVPRLAFVKAVRGKLIGSTAGDYPIAKGLLGLQAGDVNGTELFGNMFPAGATTVNIPGIGEVLTVTQLIYVDPFVLRTPTP